jgi:hypothetical protein
VGKATPSLSVSDVLPSPLPSSRGAYCGREAAPPLACLASAMNPKGGASDGAVGSRPDLELEPSAGALPLPLLRKSSTNEARPRVDNPPSDEEGLNQSQFGRSSLAVGRGVDEGEKAGARGLRGEEEGPGATAVEGAGDAAPIHIT